MFYKFIFIGLVNALFGYGCYCFFLATRMHYSLALLLSTIFGVLFNFKTIGRYVFNSQSNRLIYKFGLAYIILYFINVIGIGYISSYGYSNQISALVMLFPISLLSFVLNKKMIFQL